MPPGPARELHLPLGLETVFELRVFDAALCRFA
jgi:hypothetical protein